ncbi:pyrroline-5-carboxylate reductase family protein [Brevundimonas sp.]|uniref:pyrroline-5-carboxylate reductase family protein n=1 Tax=Brevundimonas sp. TaxID=1871086 RepID=UPI002D58787B|nr:pyrroline-5-carboxylate reductase dimerization domain-containing protein [Brevundimonas sp.]HYC75192.1 pyrroline-5-carboxylate reductase dimerization domain-containing protein [Brevundimonas sp.]
MTDHSPGGAVVLVGCGRLGSAILEGWLATGTVTPADLIILTPSEKAAAEAARARGALVNPSVEALGGARAAVLAVKPAKWREALAPVLAGLPSEATIVSVMAGVRAGDIGAVAGRPVARVMPTTGVAQARGVAALWSGDAEARETARGLFGLIAEVVDLGEEAQMDAATAVAGSAPAFIHAFVQGLARAGEAQGLSREAAERLARGALRSAGAGVETGSSLDDLIVRVASPGGTTRSGLDAMQAGGDLERAARAAVEAAVQRARTISG